MKSPWIDTDDAALLQLIAHDRHRGQQAFAELVRRHGAYLHSVARALADDDASDVVQETFLAVLKTTFHSRSSVRTWLVQIAVKQAALVRRKRRLNTGLHDQLRAQSSEPKAQHAGADARMDLATVLAELSEEHRIVLVMRELEGLSYEQIAQSLGLPRGTVESRLHRARNALRERFKDFFS